MCQVVSKNQVVQMGRWTVTAGQKVITNTVQVGPEMLPSFRLVAYYAVPEHGQDIVADSLWVDMEDVCMGTVSLQLRPVATLQGL